MRRFFLTLTCTVVLTLGTTLPVAGTGLTLVTLRCTDGTNITAQVDEDTLAGLVDAVQGMSLYPAGMSCSLLQVPVLFGIGGAASAAPNGGFVVGSGRFRAPCATAPLTYWVNFAITAETQGSAAGPVVSGGSVNFATPAGQCVGDGYVAAAPTCLAINADQPKPPAGSWYAYLVTGRRLLGALASSFPIGASFGSGWKDTGNPGKQATSDGLALDYTSSCPQLGSPNPDGDSFAVVNGNVTIKVARWAKT